MPAPTNSLIDRLRQHSPFPLFLLSLLAMSLSFAWQAKQWLRFVEAPAVVQSAPPPAAPVRVEPSPQLHALFGAPANEQIAREAPTTSLQLTLLASFMHRPSERSAALIEVTPGSPAQRLEIGDELSPGVTLYAVFKDYVVLLRHGRQESLRFPETQGTPTFFSSAAAPVEQALDDRYLPSPP